MVPAHDAPREGAWWPPPPRVFWASEPRGQRRPLDPSIQGRRRRRFRRRAPAGPCRARARARRLSFRPRRHRRCTRRRRWRWAPNRRESRPQIFGEWAARDGPRARLDGRALTRGWVLARDGPRARLVGRRRRVLTTGLAPSCRARRDCSDLRRRLRRGLVVESHPAGCCGAPSCRARRDCNDLRRRLRRLRLLLVRLLCARLLLLRRRRGLICKARRDGARAQLRGLICRQLAACRARRDVPRPLGPRVA